MGVIVFTKDKCPDCTKVKLFLGDEEIEFSEVCATRDEIKRLYSVDITHFPAVFSDGQYIGDFRDTMIYFSEPLLKPSTKRFTTYPIQYEQFWKMFKKHQASIWTAEEMGDFQKDLRDYSEMPPEKQQFINHVLAFFAASDGIVNENLVQKFSNEVQLPECRAFYGIQIYIENVHGEVYSLLLDTYIKNQEEKMKYLNAIQTIPAVKRKAEWALRWITNSKSFAERLVAFICVEGIFFSASFCAIFWLKQEGLMPTLTFSNELISRDEGLHQEFGEMMYNFLNNKLSHERVLEIILSATECEEQYVKESLPVDMIGMNSSTMTQYVHFVADSVLNNLGVPKHFNQSNPYDFMDLISLSGKSDFFEKKVGEYQMSGVMAGAGTKTFSLDAEF